MEIAVSTPTGNVGSRVAQLLVQSGLRPRLLCRDASRIPADVRSSSAAVEVDLGDGDALVAATEGVDALYWVSPATMGEDPVGAHEAFGINALRAVQKNGIKRTVFQSSGGAEKRHGVGEIDGLARTEVMFDEAGVSVTHLRCGYFFTNLLMSLDQLKEGVLTTTLPLDYRLPWVSPSDIAEIAVLRLLNASWSGRQVQAVHGPADLSFTEAADVISEATGRKIEAVQTSDDDVRAALASMGMPTGAIEAIVGMSAGLRENYVPEDKRSLVTTTPTTLSSWAFEQLRPLL